MRACKRIEIVIERLFTRRLVELLGQVGAPGYTLIPQASGQGDRGLRRADDPNDTQTNCVCIVACDEALASEIVEGVRPLLSEAGGVCLVSDALWVKH